MRLQGRCRSAAACAIAALAGGLGAIAPAEAGTAIARSIAVSDTTRIVIANTFGDIEVLAGEHDRVRLEGSLGAKTTLELLSSGGVLTIAAGPPKGHSVDAPAATHLVVYVPLAARVEVRSIMAAVRVRDLSGTLDVFSSTGDITVDTDSTAIRASSISGAIAVSDSAPNARITLEDISGAVSVRGVSGSLAWTSISGSLDVTNSAPARADLRSTSGSIRLRCGIKPDARYQISSAYGPITFQTLTRPDARFSLSTRYGLISNEFAPSPEGGDRRVSQFTVGRGAAAVSMKTESGSIVLE